MLTIIIIFIGLGIGLLSMFLIRRRVKTLPDLSDDDFVRKFNEVYRDVSTETVLQERDNLARQLGIPCQKLDPSYSFDELSKYLESLGSYSLAIGDLESTVSEQFEKLGVKKPYKNPSNLAELIHEIVQAKASVKEKGSMPDK